MFRTKRLLALIMVIAMLMQTLAVSGFALSTSDFTDFPNDWSTEAMTAAVENGLLVGTTDTTIDPTAYVTRAQFAAIITRAFGATTVADISHFDDVEEGNWFYEPVARAVKMGVMVGTSDNTFDPNAYMRREDIFLTLARVLFISDDDESVLDKFSDKADIDSWAKEAIIGMTEEGYVNGYEDGTLLPKGYVRRNEIAQLFHNIFRTYISEPGEYKSVSQLGSVIIRSEGVVLKNVTVTHDLVLADGIGAGNLDVQHVDVKGRIIARGGEGTVDFVDVSSAGNVIINDVNGTVNFHNYRDEAPFLNNLVENTPATFLARPSSTGSSIGGGGVVVSKKTVYFLDYDETTELGKIENKSSTYEIKAEDLPTVAPGARPGYTFLGWALDKDETDEAKIFTNEELTGMTVKQLLKVSADTTVTYIAVYKANVVLKEYTITFKTDAGDVPVNVTEGEAVNPSDIPVMPTDDYKKFVGWTEDKSKTDDADLVDLSKNVDDLFGDDTDVPLYPVYEYKVEFEGVADPIISRNPGYTADEAELPADPSKPGFVFKGWNTDPAATSGNLKEYFTGNSISAIAGKYYPIFEEEKPEYTITFVDTRDGSSVKLENVVKGTPIAAGDIQTPTYDANVYRFLGWSTEATGATAFVTTESFTGKLVESLSETYYAYFEEKEEYKVEFKYADNGEEAITPVVKNLFPTDASSDYTLTSSDVYDVDYHTTPGDYRFLGWTTTPSGTNYIPSSELVGKSLKEIDGTTYYAQFEEKKETYTVNFKDAESGSEVYAPVTAVLKPSEDKTIGEISAVADPAKTGYTFKYWTLTEDGTGETYTTTQVNAASIKSVNGKTFYAQYEINEGTYVVYFKDAESGSQVYAPVTAVLTDFEDKTIGEISAVADPAKTGYTFKYWTLTEDGTGETYTTTQVNATSIKSVNGKTFYAQYEINEGTYVVYFKDAESGSEVYAPVTAVLTDFEDKTIGEISAVADPAKTGYTFKYWTLTEDGTGETYTTTQVNATSIKSVNGKTFYAQYEINEGTYVVYFKDAESGSEVYAPVTAVLTDFEDKTIGEISAVADPAKTGYTFKYWTLTEDGTGETYTTTQVNATSIKSVNGKTFYAQYEINEGTYVVYFKDAESGSEVYAPVTAVLTDFEDKTIGEISAVADPAKTGYTFKYWTLTEDGTGETYTTTQVNAASIKSVNGKTFYAQYEINEGTYVVYFKDAESGSEVYAPVTAVLTDFEDKTIGEISAVADPAKTGYTFKYWTLTEDGTGETYTTTQVNAASIKSVNGKTFYAQYEINEGTYVVYFRYTNDDLIEEVSKVLTDLQTDVVGTREDPDHYAIPSDYEFLYWTEAKDGTGEQFTSADFAAMDIKSANGKTFYAQFKKLSDVYFVEFKFAHDLSEALDKVEKTLSASEEYFLSDADVYDVEHPDDATAVERYVFLGWTTDVDSTDYMTSAEVVGSDLKLVDGTVYYAHFDVYYKVTFVDYYSVLNGDMDVVDDWDTVYDYLPGDPYEYSYLDGYVDSASEELFYVKKGEALGYDNGAYDLVTKNYLHNYNEFANPILGYGKDENSEYMHENTDDVDTDVIEGAGAFNYQHKIDYEWYLVSEDGEEVTFFDFDMAITENLVVFSKLKQVQVSLKLPAITDKVELILHFPYESDGRFVDALRDGLHVSRDNIETALTTAVDGETFEEKFYGKLANAGVVTDASTRELANFADFSPINMVYFYQLMGGKADFADWLWEQVEDNLEDDIKAIGGTSVFNDYFSIKAGRKAEPALKDFFSDSYTYKDEIPEGYQKYLDCKQFIYEIINQDYFYVTEYNDFIMEKVYGKISGLTDVNDMIEKFAGGKVPAGVLSRLPVDKFAPAYEKRVEYFLETLTEARVAAKTPGTEPIPVDSGIVLDFNLVEEIAKPLIEYSAELHEDALKAAKKKADGGNRAAELFYKYYGENKYMSGMVDKYADADLFFYETGDDTVLSEKYAKVDYADGFKTYGVQDFMSIYDDVILPMSVDTIDAFIMITDENAKCYFDIERVTNVLRDNKEVLLAFYNHINSMMSGYAKNGLPETMEQYWLDLNSDATVAEYIEKLDNKVPFDVEHYVAKLVNNATIDTFYTRILSKAGAPVETLLSKYPDKEFTSEQFDKFVDELDKMWQAKDGVPAAAYTADEGFDFMFGLLGIEDGDAEIERSGISFKVAQKYGDDVYN